VFAEIESFELDPFLEQQLLFVEREKPPDQVQQKEAALRLLLGEE
jgi:hypothetical protein